MELNTQLSKKTKNIKSPTVTVLMSVYNGEKYLREAIDSILNQTFKDFEFLIINDGSTDRTAEILQSYRDPRIKIISNEKNIGLTKSLNKGLRIAKSKYIARQDADDISLLQRLEKEVNFLEKYKETGLIGSSFHFINENNKLLTTHKVLTENDEIKRNLIKGNQFGHGSVMFRRECLHKVGFYRIEFRLAQDYDFWLRISEKYNIANISDPLYKWRVSFRAISIAKKDEQDRYMGFARELAKERRTYGKDRLQVSSKEEIRKILDNLFPKIKERSKAETERIERKEMVRFYQRRGVACLFQRKRGRAMEQFLISLKYNPCNIKSYLYLCFTLLPLDTITILRSGKKKLKSLLRRE